MLELLISLAAGVNRTVEVTKGAIEAYIRRRQPDFSLPDWSIVLLSQLIGIFATYSLNANLFSGHPQYAGLPDVAGIILTGMLVGGGSNAVNVVFELLYGVGKLIQPAPEPPPPPPVVIQERSTPPDDNVILRATLE